MMSFRLMRVGQGITVAEFRGVGILQNGQYLTIVGSDNNIVVSLNLEPGYYLTDTIAMISSNESSSAPASIRSVR
jgi:hypothetical protein